MTGCSIVQYPYAVDAITVASADSSRPYAMKSPITTSGSSNCSTYQRFSGSGGLQDNGYCLQAFVFNSSVAAVGTSSLADSGLDRCLADDSDSFLVTVSTRCQASLAACPSSSRFEHVTTMSVPRVCMQALPASASSFTTRLDLTTDAAGLYPAATYTPNSLLCGQFSITPQLLRDADLLRGYRVSSVALTYTAVSGAVNASSWPQVTSFTHQSTEVRDGSQPQWLGRFCFVLNETNVPGLYRDQDPFVPAGAIGIYRRAYTVTATVTFDPSGERRAAKRIQSQPCPSCIIITLIIMTAWPTAVSFAL